MDIHRIYIFPVKSLKGIEVQESLIDEYGFQYDRMYSLAHTGKDGSISVLTQRQEPSLARINVEIVGSELVLSYNENGKQNEARLPTNLADLPSNMPTLHVPFLAGDMECHDVGAAKPELQQFFRDFLSDKKYDGVTLIASKIRRKVRSTGPDTDAFVLETGRTFENSFQDYYPGSLMTTASCEELEYRIEMTGERVDSHGFRMNMLVRTDEPWIEDDWKRIKIGEHEWFVDQKCERCATTLVDQDSGIARPSKQPMTALGKFRVINKGRPPCFGLNLYNKDQGFQVRVGDRVEVLEISD